MDADAWGWVLENHKLACWVAGRCGYPASHPDHEDAVSVATIGLFRGRRGWQPGRGAKPSAYATIAARRLVLGWQEREMQRRALTGLDGGRVPGPPTSCPVEAADERRVLRAAIRKLPAADRVVVRAKLAGRSNAEIAALLSVRRSAGKMRYAAAVRRLRALMAH